MMTDSGRLLIRGGRVYDHDGDVHQPAVADVLVAGDRIAAVGPDLAAQAAGATVIDAAGRLVIPGFVNAHYHSHDVLAKGLIEEHPLEMWQLLTGPLGAGRSKAELRLRTLVGALEALRNGITTIQDMSTFAPFDEEVLDTILAAYEEAGIRVVYAIQVRDLSNVTTVPYWKEFPADIQAIAGNADVDPKPLADFVAAQLRRRATPGPRGHWALGPSAPQRCTPPLWEAVVDMASRHDLPVYTHVYETKAQALLARQQYGNDGGSLLGFLDRMGALDGRLTIAHGVWLAPDDIARMAERDVGLVMNFLSNMRIKSGIAPIPLLRDKGVRLALGSDNCSCSDTINLFQAMKLFCILNAVSEPEPTTMSAAEAVRAATLGGARTARLQDQVGAIKPGRKADLAILDLSDVAFVPFNSAARQLVYSESGRGVETVIVDGRIVMRDRRMQTVDEAALRAEVADHMAAFRRDFSSYVAAAAPAMPHVRAAHKRIWAEDVGFHRYAGGRMPF
ncbi:MAG: amidohydrolase family protein [Rhodospirillaceae bacterium]